jgi:rare lipoprotein A
MQALSLARRHTAWIAAAAAVLAAAGCAQTKLAVHAAKEIKAAAAPEEKPAGIYKVGAPYQVNGAWYYPAVDYAYSATGIASWYGQEFHGRSTANGETFDMNAVTAAHKTLPLPSLVRVTNLENGRSIIVRVNDRGPFAHGRIIDVSRRAAQLLGFEREGTTKARVEILPDESRQLALSLPRTPGEAEASPAVKAVPRIAVEAEALPAPGAVAAPEPKVALHSEKWASVAPTRPPEAAASAPEPVVTYEPVRPTNIYIQAGAFLQFDNANRLRAKLSPLGRVQVTSAKLSEQEMFRVRLGPVVTVEEADRLLERLIHAGHTDARLIVAE